jgi:hypothetical protein
MQPGERAAISKLERVPMKKVELNLFRSALESKQTDIRNGIGNREALAIETSPDELDRIQHASERDMVIGNLERDSARLVEVREALRRIQCRYVRILRWLRRGYQSEAPCRDPVGFVLYRLPRGYGSRENTLERDQHIARHGSLKSALARQRRPSSGCAALGSASTGKTTLWTIVRCVTDWLLGFRLSLGWSPEALGYLDFYPTRQNNQPLGSLFSRYHLSELCIQPWPKP